MFTCMHFNTLNLSKNTLPGYSKISLKILYMTAFLFRMCFVSFLLLATKFSMAQKSIIISDNLIANAEKLPVKMGNSWPWKIARFSFGDYTVVSSRVGWGNGSSKSNFFGTKAQSKSSQKFSFVLANKTNDSARVNAVNNIITQEVYPLELFPNVFFESYSVLKDSNNFSALITLNEDTSDIWTMFIVDVKGENVENKYEAFLNNRERTIFLSYTSADKNNREKRMLSARGYEFIENELSLCAVEYFGGGMLGVGKKTVWIRKELDPKIKLILAAAMTTIMQFIQPGPTNYPL